MHNHIGLIACIFILNVELHQANSEYETKLTSSGCKDSIMFSLCWDIDELNKLKEDLQKIRVEIGALLRTMSEQSDDTVCVNIPLKLGALRGMLERSIKAVTKFKRIPATHMFVIMISCELRESIPYAIPIQCLPCKTLKEVDIREIINTVLREMTANILALMLLTLCAFSQSI